MSGARKPRRHRLGAEDRAIWRAVTRHVTPLDPARAEAPAEAPTPQPVSGRAVTEPAPCDGAAAPRPVASLRRAEPAPVTVGRPEPGIDRRTAERLRRGARAPDARIDLHGMTAARAHGVLEQFIEESLGRGLRCVLVITGKGGRESGAGDAPFMAPETGLLREAVPKWLRGGRHARHLVGIYAAHRRHGGAGALYVYLKKRR